LDKLLDKLIIFGINIQKEEAKSLDYLVVSGSLLAGLYSITVQSFEIFSLNHFNYKQIELPFLNLLID